MANNDNIFVQLEEDYGLERILEQNDLEPWRVIRILFGTGHIDIDDYLFTELEIDGED